MTDSKYIGIDYSMGLANRDSENDIHYGVISQNTITQYIWDDMESVYWYGCSSCGTEFEDGQRLDQNEDGEDNEDGEERCPFCGHTEDDDSNWYSEESIGEIYNPGVKDGYELDYSESLCSFFVIKSPFYTFAMYCSPCAPGAGDLNSPADGGVKSYCLGEDFFDEYSKCPYTIYSVETNEIVFTPEKEEDEVSE